MRAEIYVSFAFLLIFIMVFAGCGTRDDDEKGVTPTGTQVEVKPHAKDENVPEIDDYKDKDIKDFIDDLKDAGKPDVADALTQKIKASKVVLGNFGGIGYVIVGRVVVEGPEDPRDVNAQMEILGEGYFAGPVKDLSRPVGFRLHGYSPFDLELRGKKGNFGSVVNVGTIHIIPLLADKLASLHGKIILDGDFNSSTAEIILTILNGPTNTPHNGTEGRPHWPDPIKATILPSGEFFADGFSPTEYYIKFSSPKHVTRWFYVSFKSGETLDLGAISLETPKRIKLTYYVSGDLNFNRAKEKQMIIDAGTKWKALDDMQWGWDLEFKQKDGKVTLDWSYGPCYIADIGTGDIKDFLDVSVGRAEFLIPRDIEPKNGHIYLLDQKCFRHWVLFKYELE